MQDQNLGIAELIDTAVDILEATDLIATAFADGVQITDGFTLLAVAPKVQEIAKDGRTAIEELLDLTADEADEAAAEIARRTGKAQTGIIQRVNEGFTLCARSYRLYTTGRNLGNDWVRFGKSFKKIDQAEA